MIPFENKNGWKFLLLLLLIFIVIAPIYIIVQQKRNSKYEYVEAETCVSGLIQEIEVSSRSYFLIQFRRGKKILISPLRNNSLQYVKSKQLLQKGDSIVKHSYSDTIFVHRKDKVCYYLLKY